ncbi:hypothetical protein KEM56_004218, partial [Ascosphaera pollenicola]
MELNAGGLTSDMGITGAAEGAPDEGRQEAISAPDMRVLRHVEVHLRSIKDHVLSQGAMVDALREEQAKANEQVSMLTQEVQNIGQGGIDDGVRHSIRQLNVHLQNMLEQVDGISTPSVQYDDTASLAPQETDEQSGQSVPNMSDTHLEQTGDDAQAPMFSPYESTALGRSMRQADLRDDQPREREPSGTRTFLGASDRVDPRFSPPFPAEAVEAAKAAERQFKVDVANPSELPEGPPNSAPQEEHPSPSPHNQDIDGEVYAEETQDVRNTSGDDDVFQEQYDLPENGGRSASPQTPEYADASTSTSSEEQRHLSHTPENVALNLERTLEKFIEVYRSCQQLTGDVASIKALLSNNPFIIRPDSVAYLLESRLEEFNKVPRSCQQLTRDVASIEALLSNNPLITRPDNVTYHLERRLEEFNEISRLCQQLTGGANRSSNSVASAEQVADDSAPADQAPVPLNTVPPTSGPEPAADGVVPVGQRPVHPNSVSSNQSKSMPMADAPQGDTKPVDNDLPQDRPLSGASMARDLHDSNEDRTQAGNTALEIEQATAAAPAGLVVDSVADRDGASRESELADSNATGTAHPENYVQDAEIICSTAGNGFENAVAAPEPETPVSMNGILDDSQNVNHEPAAANSGSVLEKEDKEDEDDHVQAPASGELGVVKTPEPTAIIDPQPALGNYDDIQAPVPDDSGVVETFTHPANTVPQSTSDSQYESDQSPSSEPQESIQKQAESADVNPQPISGGQDAFDQSSSSETEDLKQSRFTVDAEPTDTIKILKQKISAVKTEWHPEAMKLIYSGKVLQDDRTVESYNIEEKGYLVCMVQKPKQTSPAAANKNPSTPAAASDKTPSCSTTGTDAAAQAPQRNAPQPSVGVTVMPGAEPATPSPSARTAVASSVSTGGPLNENSLLLGAASQNAIAEMEAMGFPRDMATRAMRAAFFNPDRAIEYLLNGIPESAERALEAQEQQQQQPQQPSQGTTTAGTQGTGAPTATPSAVPASTNTTNTTAQGSAQQPSADEPINLFEAAASAAAQQGQQPRASNPAAAAAAAGLPSAPTVPAGQMPGGSLAFLRENPHFQNLRTIVQQQPQMLEPILQSLGQGNPQLAQAIAAHQD